MGDDTIGGQVRDSAMAPENHEQPPVAMAQGPDTMADDTSAPAINLEDKIRGMIVSNTARPQPSEAKDRLPPHMRTASQPAQQQYLAQMDEAKTKVVNPSKPAGGNPSGPSTPRKKLNQKQRRELKTELDIPPPASPTTNQGRNINRPQLQHYVPPQSRAQNQQSNTRSQQQWRNSPEPNQQQRPRGFSNTQPASGPAGGAHMQTQNPQSHRGSVSSNAPGGLPFQNQTPNYPAREPQPVQSTHQPAGFHRVPPPPNLGYSSGPSIRPPPQNRQLYQPYGHGNSFKGPPQHAQPTLEEIKAQSQFLEEIARVEVRGAEMSAEEFRTKETFRALLESVCQQIIGALEAIEHENTPRVTLKCFGSLSSGFATKASDMDLALLSPMSVPEVSSLDSPIPRLLEKAFLDLGYGARLLTHTRVPIIKICESPAPGLLESLKKEREKWELHKDDPPQQTKKKVAASKKESDAVDHPKRLHEVGQVAETSGGNSPSGAKTQLQDDVEGANTPRIENKDQDESRMAGSHALKDGDKDEPGSVTADKGKDTDLGPDSHSQVTISNPPIGSQQLPQKPLNSGQSTEESPKVHANAPEPPGKSPNPRNPKPRPPRDTSLEFPKTGIGIQCDLNFSNHLALHNTLLLRCYSHADPRVRPMVIFVKAWAKTRTINSPYHGTLSSYGYVLMVLHYLVNIATPPVVPNLQLLWHRSSAPEGENDDASSSLIEGYDIRFWRDEAQIASLAASGQLTENRSSLGVLLRGFFLYYAHQGLFSPGGGFNWSQSVLSLRTPGGLLTKREKGWTGAKTTVDGKDVENRTGVGKEKKTDEVKTDKVNPPNTQPADNNPKSIEAKESKDPTPAGKEIRHRYLIAIEDPFETTHNVARTVTHFGICAVRDEFRRTVRILGRVGRISAASSAGRGGAGGVGSGGAGVGFGRGGPAEEGFFDIGPDREKLEREERDREWKVRDERERAEKLRKEKGERERVEREKGEKERVEKLTKEKVERERVEKGKED
ncbi:MAG: hypothetical protein M1812_002512 [Candelaria pacifica]|nr:MAG: hypothetical protein M1812_002512 [Candelaria pacifica]